jgi:hypothetical protein
MITNCFKEGPVSLGPLGGRSMKFFLLLADSHIVIVNSVTPHPPSSTAQIHLLLIPAESIP